MAPTDRIAAPAPEALVKPLLRLLRPLVRLLLKSGITFPVLTDLLRSLYIDVAKREILTDAKTRTDSRLSLLTGIHRKEIKRLRDSTVDAETVSEIVTVSSAIIARWLGTPAFTDAAGGPKPLPRQSPAGSDAPSFDAIVALVTTDVRSRTVLDDWISQKIVTVGADDLIHLNTSAFVPRPGRDEQLYYFARNIHDHIAAAAENVAATEIAPFLERAVHYDQLSPAVANRLLTISREQGQRLLIEINRLALELLDAEEANGSAAKEQDGPTMRVNLGIYLYAEDETPEESHE